MSIWSCIGNVVVNALDSEGKKLEYRTNIKTLSLKMTEVNAIMISDRSFEGNKERVEVKLVEMRDMINEILEASAL